MIQMLRCDSGELFRSFTLLLMQWKTLDFRRELVILTAGCFGRFENADWTGVAREARIFVLR